jgi:hypothetical protein
MIDADKMAAECKGLLYNYAEATALYVTGRMSRDQKGAACDAAEAAIDSLAALASAMVREPQQGMFPCAKLVVGEDDSITATLYAPGLPPGEHYVYPEPCDPSGAAAPSMFTAVVECPACGDEFGVNDYEAGHIRGAGHCGNCAAARGIDSPEGVETGTGSTAKPQEPGAAGTRPEGMAAQGEAPPPSVPAGWISVEDRLPEPGVEVIGAGQGWGAPFSMACWYDGERREWWPAGTHWTDANGAGPQYPTHWMPLPQLPAAPPPEQAQPAVAVLTDAQIDAICTKQGVTWFVPGDYDRDPWTRVDAAQMRKIVRAALPRKDSHG